MLVRLAVRHSVIDGTIDNRANNELSTGRRALRNGNNRCASSRSAAQNVRQASRGRRTMEGYTYRLSHRKLAESRGKF